MKIEGLDFLDWDINQPITDELMESIKQQVEGFITKIAGRKKFNRFLASYIELADSYIRYMIKEEGWESKDDLLLMKSAYLAVLTESRNKELGDNGNDAEIFARIIELVLADIAADIVIEAYLL